jgi:cell division protein FtsN
MKKIGLLVMALCVVMVFSTSCKSKQSAYRTAYEQAKAREMAEQANDDEFTPVTKPISSSETRQERINPIAGENAAGLRLYSVVIGSFQNRTNAFGLKDRMTREGYRPVIAENDFGMYRVIVSSFDGRADAARARDALKTKYKPNFQDAWLLERRY